MIRLLLVASLFFLFQSTSPAHGSESKSSGSQRNELPRSFLSKSESNVVINKRGESIFLSASGSTLEEILQKIAEERKVVLKFHCNDPSLKQERAANLKISADSLLKTLLQLLPKDYRFSILNRDGMQTENERDIAAVNIYPQECAGTDLPVRAFIPGRDHPVLKKPPEEVSLEELGNVIKTEGPAARRRAADILGIKGDEEAIPYAKEALKDTNPGVMLAAANALKRLGQKHGPEKVSGVIYQRFLEKPYAEFLPIMAQVDKDKIWPIFEELIDQSNEQEKKIMATALFLTQDRRAIKYLSRIAFAAGSAENSRQAIHSIGQIGGPEAASVLMKLFREGDAERQAMAVQAVYFLPKGDGSEVRAEVEKAVKDDKVSDTLLRALVGVSYLEPLEQLMKDPGVNPDLKVRTLRIMAMVGSEKTIPVMGVALNDQAPRVRLASVEAMGTMVTEEAIPHLIRATEDKDLQVRSGAVKALSEFPGDDRVARALGKATDDADQRVRKAAADALAALGKPSETMVEVLKNCENNKDPYVAKKASSILSHWGRK
jgi:HEAT repeat protein